jgi:histone acetyltransferase (RNA polymerase elongator complex component)
MTNRHRTDKNANRRTLIIPVFLPWRGCSHQCTFCNQITITGVRPQRPLREELRFQAERFLKYRKHRPARIQIAIFGGNFLGLPQDDIKALLAEATLLLKSWPGSGIRFSTRPDTITAEQLELIREFPVQTVEIGVQSMNDDVLARTWRGHTAQDTVKAMALLKQSSYAIGVQMMTGLPADTPAGALETGRRIVALAPAFVRIYPVLVLKNSPLAKQFQNGQYTPPSLEESVTLVKQLWRLFNQNKITVIRMGLQVTETLIRKGEILAGPFHPSFGHLVYEALFFDMAATVIESTFPKPQSIGDTIVLSVHPRDISKMRGLNNGNIRRFKEKFKVADVKVVPDSSLSQNSVVLGEAIITEVGGSEKTES